MNHDNIRNLLGLPEMTVHYEAALPIDVEELMQASLQKPLRFGDIVTLRDHVPDDRYDAFKKGHHIIVTQVFPVKHDMSNVDNAAGGKPVDIALAIRASSRCNCGDPKCANQNRDEVVEFLADSRSFIKVGRLAGMPD